MKNNIVTATFFFFFFAPRDLPLLATFCTTFCFFSSAQQQSHYSGLWLLGLDSRVQLVLSDALRVRAPKQRPETKLLQRDHSRILLLRCLLVLKQQR